ncbi:MAG: hypothetical protein M0005_13960 [Actinomycetota bacterium]|nr:hypothetical protein [Actinomycetota bacterium]
MARSLRIVVDVDPLSAPLEGVLSSGSHAGREFVGLVELLAALEEVVREERRDDEQAPWPGLGH